jgi:hypothetical protein
MLRLLVLITLATWLDDVFILVSVRRQSIAVSSVVACSDLNSFPRAADSMHWVSSCWFVDVVVDPLDTRSNGEGTGKNKERKKQSAYMRALGCSHDESAMWPSFS